MSEQTATGLETKPLHFIHTCRSTSANMPLFLLLSILHISGHICIINKGWRAAYRQAERVWSSSTLFTSHPARDRKLLCFRLMSCSIMRTLMFSGQTPAVLTNGFKHRLHRLHGSWQVNSGPTDICVHTYSAAHVWMGLCLFKYSVGVSAQHGPLCFCLLWCVFTEVHTFLRAASSWGWGHVVVVFPSIPHKHKPLTMRGTQRRQAPESW